MWNITPMSWEWAVFPDQPPWGQQSLKLDRFFSLLLKIKKSKHIFSLSTQDLCAKGMERLLPGIDPWHMQVSESAVLQIPAQRVLSPPCGALIIVFDILYFPKTHYTAARHWGWPPHSKVWIQRSLSVCCLHVLPTFVWIPPKFKDIKL